MAKLVINEILDFGTGGYLEATSWQVALDANFTQIIDQSLNDTVNLTEWHTMLPKIGGGGYYADLNLLYARVKVNVNGYTSPWFVMEPKTQNYQAVTISETGKPDIHTDSDAIGMQ